MIKSLTIAATFIFFGAALSAQELVFSMEATDSCLAVNNNLDAQESCIGTSAQMCMQNTTGGQSTVGMGGCLDAEREQWDGRLNATYQQVMASEKAEDAEMADIGASVPNRANALRDMQRAWIIYRDMRCTYVRAQWGGGTGGGPATLDCLMNMTGQQALFLQSMLNN